MSVPEATQEPPRTVVRGESARDRSARLAASEIGLLVLMLVSVAISQAFPFKAVKFALMGVLGAVFVGLVVRYPALALAMLAFVTPVVDILPSTLMGIRGLNAETLLVAFAILIWLRSNQMRGRDNFGPPISIYLLIYALLIVGSSINAALIWHKSIVDVLSSAKNHLCFMIFLPVAFHVARTRREQGLLIGATALALLLNSLQAINHSWMAFFTGTLERHRAMAILALQPNTFGAALAMYLPAFILLASNKTTNRLSQLWCAGVAAAMGFALLLTLSRGSWLGLIAGMVAVAVLGDRKLLVVLAIAGASYTAWVPQAAIDRVEETTQVGVDAEGDQLVEGSAQMRLEQYMSLSAMMAPRPVLGWGYESYPRVFEKYGTLQRAKGAHSSYVQLGTEGGVVGLASLGVLLLAVVWAGWRAYRVCPDPLHRWLGMGVLGGMLSMAVSMITGARFEPQKIFVFFWIMTGIVQRETVVALTRRAAPRLQADAPATRSVEAAG